MLLQTHVHKRRLTRVDDADYTEDNVDLCSDRHDPLSSPTAVFGFDLVSWLDRADLHWTPSGTQPVIMSVPHHEMESVHRDVEVHSLDSDGDPNSSMRLIHSAMQHLCTQRWIGLNNDFTQLQVHHPAARCALEVQQSLNVHQPVLHIYTDGSCKGPDAAWAFVLVAQLPSHNGSSFWKIGFAADVLDDTIGPFNCTAMDAEATALIAAAEFLLPIATLEQTVHFHFDAAAVGYGAFGAQATPTYHGDFSSRQHACYPFCNNRQGFLHSMFMLMKVIHSMNWLMASPVLSVQDGGRSSNLACKADRCCYTHVVIGHGLISCRMKWCHHCQPSCPTHKANRGR